MYTMKVDAAMTFQVKLPAGRVVSMTNGASSERKTLRSFLLASPRISGLLVALFALAAWLEPTLWPRNLLERALSLGIVLAFGYAIGGLFGLAGMWLWKTLGLPRPGDKSGRWLVAAATAVVAVTALLFWQARQGELVFVVGATQPSVVEGLLLIGLATTVAVALVLVGRGLFWSVYQLDGWMAGRMPGWMAHLAAAAVIVAVALLTMVVGANALTEANRDIVDGPELTATPQQVSLSATFPSAAGWDPSGLDEARRFSELGGLTSVVVLHDGRVVAEWGDTSLVTDVRSVRKSIVSALYGIAIERGLIDASATLAELDIDDVPALTEQERQATIEHVITARSGIYHPSIRDDDIEGRPPRGSSAPGAAFYYNNWDFNTAGGIFEEVTGLSLGKALLEWIAIPIGMEDFTEEHVLYESSVESRFPAFRMLLSTRDLARFGLLMGQNGVWNGQQVISAEWIERSTAPHSVRADGVGYAHMWWTDGDAFFASGSGGQRVYIEPASGLVIVVKVNTGQGLAARLLWDEYGPNQTYGEFRDLVALIVAATP
jgi:CubicO group peptidase (beta-lactamase class C family)